MGDEVESHRGALEHLEDSLVPSALDHLEQIEALMGGMQLAFFLDYDGTLTPIVEASDAAVLAAPMRAAIARLARHAPVAVVSGRAREKVREFVAVENLYYAGSHGFDIDGPGGLRKQVKTSAVPILRAARSQLEVWLRDVAGASVEDNVFSVSIHWRRLRTVFSL